MLFDVGTFLSSVMLISFLVALVNVPEFIRSSRLYRRRDGFRCTCCGNCCRFKVTPLKRSDVKRLEDAGLRYFYETRGELRLKRVNGRCIFLKDDRCTVHESRPQVCRDFPFFVEWGLGYAQRVSFCPAMEALENG